MNKTAPQRQLGGKERKVMKQGNIPFNGNGAFGQAILIWPSGIHGGKKPDIYALGLSEEETEAIRNYLEQKLTPPEQSG